jgi:hypothetical protein
MIRKIALLAGASLFAVGIAAAQTPPPGNVNPGSMDSGAEQTGAPNQPRSPGVNNPGTRNPGAMRGTTGAAPKAGTSRQDDGINANVKPSSKESGSEPAGEPANQRR